MTAAILFSHADGRYAVAPDGAGFGAGDPQWVRVGPAVMAAFVAPQAEPEPNLWKAAVDDALVTNCLDCIGPNESPLEALCRLIQWETQIALDPAVSSDARALIDRGRAETQSAQAEPAPEGMPLPDDDELEHLWQETQNGWIENDISYVEHEMYARGFRDGAEYRDAQWAERVRHLSEENERWAAEASHVGDLLCAYVAAKQYIEGGFESSAAAGRAWEEYAKWRDHIGTLGVIAASPPAQSAQPGEGGES